MLGERHLRWLAAQTGLTLADVRFAAATIRFPFTSACASALQAFAYDTFQDAPSERDAAAAADGAAAVRAPRSWTTAPALNYRADHIVAFLGRPNR